MYTWHKNDIKAIMKEVRPKLEHSMDPDRVGIFSQDPGWTRALSSSRAGPMLGSPGIRMGQAHFSWALQQGGPWLALREAPLLVDNFSPGPGQGWVMWTSSRPGPGLKN